MVTHPDKDHYNLLPDVLAGVDVGHVYMVGPPSEHDADDVDTWLAAFSASKRTELSQTTFDPAGTPNSAITAGDADVYVLAGNIQATDSPVNARSIVLLVDYDDFQVILTGDATFDTEETILSRYNDAWLDVAVLKLGHHGSSTTSTSADWLEATRPELAVASAGYDNTYGHPRKSVVEAASNYTTDDAAHPIRWGWWNAGHAEYGNVDDYEEAVYSTATSNTIVVTSNGSGTFAVSTVP